MCFIDPILTFYRYTADFENQMNKPERLIRILGLVSNLYPYSQDRITLRTRPHRRIL